jgi:hypothetical protein
MDFILFMGARDRHPECFSEDLKEEIDILGK